MSAQRSRLTPELIISIESRVKGGAYPMVAAQACGIPPDVFQQWMDRGTSKPTRPPYREFADRIHAAVAYARCMAEIDMRTENPRGWLLNGPGKDSPSRGWTGPARASLATPPEGVNLLMDPQFQELLARLLTALAPFPEARAAAAAVFWDEETPTRQIPLRRCDDERPDSLTADGQRGNVTP
jgi:hypothetical protein